MVDLLGGGNHTSITLANVPNNFTFKVGGGGAGSNATPSTWVNAPNPIAVSARTNVNQTSNGAGTVTGSDCIELIWDDNAIQQQRLEVIVNPTTNTGLAANTVFFYDNEIGNTSSFNTSTVARTGTSDFSGVQTHGAVLSANIPITNAFDFDPDGKVGTSGASAIQTHGTATATGLKLLALAIGGPFAPDALPAATPALATSGDPGFASALAATSRAFVRSLPAIPVANVHRLGQLDSNHELLAKSFKHLAHENTAKAKAILVEADALAAALHLEDALLDSLPVGLGLE